jgi:hypothetical protein
MSGYTGFMEPQDLNAEFLASSFLVTQIINKLATTALVQVMAVTNAGGVSPVGTVDVKPMVHQVDGAGNPTEHAIIHNVPYFRLQGGTDAIILDPKVGDIGIAVFCSRDISAVQRTKAPAPPSSARKFDWADSLYVGGVLNAAPVQYVQFEAGGITVNSPTKITLTAPNIQINGTTAIVGATSVQGNVATTGTLTNNSHDVGSTHRHLQSGGNGTGGVPV